MNPRLKYLVLTLLGGFLPAIGWPPAGFPLPLFFGFVPFFLLETLFGEKGRGKWFYAYTYLGLFLFNLSTTWWVWNASPGGAVFMLFANSFLMLLPFMLYRFAKREIGLTRGLVLFIAAWLSFEYLHFNWQVNYPWLTLGNGFAATPNLVQWYEYTGALGGSLWILLINVLLFSLTQAYKRITVIATTLLFVAPTLWSIYLAKTENTCAKMGGVDVLIVQPNIDPYKKFESGNAREQVDKFITLCEKGVTAETDMVIFPETALVGNFNEDYLDQNYGVRAFRRFLHEHEVDAALVGASTHHFYEEGEELPKYPRFYEPTGQYYDSYNTALFIPPSGEIDVYHKSRLVPGVESLPFPAFFKQFDALLSLDLGGVAGNLGRDEEAKTFKTDHIIKEITTTYETDNGELIDSVLFVDEKIGVAPLICYESVFGAYVGDFVNKGATFLAVITNDGWWKNTPGHKQHMHYARLRAIEYRRYVVRSANTGISCVIDDNGRVWDQLGWWEEGSIRAKIPQLRYETYYAKHGNYMGKLAVFLFVFIGLSVVVKWRVRKSGLM